MKQYKAANFSNVYADFWFFGIEIAHEFDRFQTSSEKICTRFLILIKIAE